MPNLHDPQFDEERGHEGFRARRARISHQVVNRTDSIVSFLAISTHGEPDIVLYPDAGKVGVGERRLRRGGLRRWFRLDDDVDYYDGEQPPTD